jgi:putative hydrolase of the HAD superfamily
VTSFLADIADHFSVERPTVEVLGAAADRYEAAFCAGASQIPNGAETLASLKASGLRLGLISNTMFSSQAHLDDLRRFGLDGYFDGLLFSAEANKWKPKAAPFKEVLRMLDVRPEEAVFVGDDPAADVVGGRRAGMRTIYFPSNPRFAAPDGVQPDATIYSLRELAPALDRLNGL